MRRSHFINTTSITLFAFIALSLSACKKTNTHMKYTQDFTTPQGAILCLEDAFKRRDIEAAVRCKHFPTEAKLMLKKMGHGQESDPAIVNQLTEILELSFRKHILSSWPNFSGVEVSFGEQTPSTDGIEIVSEKFHYSNGTEVTQNHYVTKTSEGWRVLNLAE